LTKLIIDLSVLPRYGFSAAVRPAYELCQFTSCTLGKLHC